MPTVKDYIEQLQRLYKPDDVIACHLWATDDVLEQAKMLGIEISQQEAEEIIESVHKHADCEYGITWLTLEIAIEEKERQRNDNR